MILRLFRLYSVEFPLNSYGYSPSKFAWLARKQGLAVAAIVDFDVLDGVDEFLDAAQMVGLKAFAGLETRVFAPEFAEEIINSPGEPGIAYHIDRVVDVPAAGIAPLHAIQFSRQRYL